LENEEEVYLYKSKKKKPVVLPRSITEILTKSYNLLFDEEEEEEEEKGYCVYQPLVYPPGSTPPTPNISKKLNFIDFNQIL